MINYHSMLAHIMTSASLAKAIANPIAVQNDEPSPEIETSPESRQVRRARERASAKAVRK